MKKIISRLAPSPTGFMHLGNAWAFILCWLLTRRYNGELILRIDDLDPDRSRETFTKGIIEDLRWLGLDWDKGPELGEDYFQSKRFSFYDKAIEDLNKNGLIYPCFCSRAELREMANAPHNNDVFLACPCRDLSKDGIKENIAKKKGHALKLKTPMEEISCQDLIYGNQIKRLEDFAVKRSDGVFAYQLASTVDDALMGVNLVVRGSDLLDSCQRQNFILKSLGYDIPKYAHIPLILDPEGERLAKRHNSLSLKSLRADGIASEQIIGLVAFWANFQSAPKPLDIHQALNIFSFQKISTSNIILPSGSLFS